MSDNFITGGWTMVGSAVVAKESEAEGVHYKTIRSDDYTMLQNVTTGKFLLSTNGLNSLYNDRNFNFTEVRMECIKPYHGRRLHLKTNGSEVRQRLHSPLSQRICS